MFLPKVLDRPVILLYTIRMDTQNYRNIIVEALIARDGELCQLCHNPFAAFAPAYFDHKDSQHNGGSHTFANLHLVHGYCNLRKGAKSLVDGIMRPKNARVARPTLWAKEQEHADHFGILVRMHVRTLRDGGLSIPDIAAKCGVSTRTVYRHLED